MIYPSGQVTSDYFALRCEISIGSDHFEAQLKYDDIQQFYLLEQNYWED